MSKAETFLKERGINPIEPIYWDVANCEINAKDSYSRIALKELLEDYFEQEFKSRVNDITTNDLETRNSLMDVETYNSYQRSDSFHKGWTALKFKLLKK